MADDPDDSWLYGAGAEEASKHEERLLEEQEEEAPVKNGTVDNKTFDHTFDEHNFEEAGDHEHLIADDSKDGVAERRSQEKDSDDSDDDDDDINVVIGDIKAGGASYNVKPGQDKQKLPGSKFNIEEFESVGTVNGQPAYEFVIESTEDKPWQKPGADITDYFNYGFNEETWRAYCERQKRMRIHESGIGLSGLTAAQNPQGNIEPRPGINIGIKRLGGPRPKLSGMIDVIGAPNQAPIRPQAPRENVIQVMTADRREYSRTVVGNPSGPMPMPFNVPPEEFYNHEEEDAFNYGYEPTQDSQWDPSQNPGWAPSEIKELTGGGMNQPPPMMGVPPPGMMPGMPRMPMNMIPGQPPMIPSLMSQVTSMPPSMKPTDSRDRRDNRDSRHYDDSRKRPRERSLSRDRERKDRERNRDDRTKYERDGRDSRYRESSSRRETRRSKSREKRRSRSREKSRRSRSKDRKTEDKDRRSDSRSDKTKRIKKEDS